MRIVVLEKVDYYGFYYFLSSDVIYSIQHYFINDPFYLESELHNRLFVNLKGEGLIGYRSLESTPTQIDWYCDRGRLGRIDDLTYYKVPGYNYSDFLKQKSCY